MPPASAQRGAWITVSIHGMVSNRFALDGAPAAIHPQNPFVSKSAGETFAVDPPADVTWSVEPPGAGTITAGGYFKPAVAGNATIRATLKSQPSISWTTTARVIGIAIDPAGGEAKKPIALSVTPTNVPTGAMYAWNFADGSTVAGLTAASTSHTYELPGTYLVTATVSGTGGVELDRATRSVEITPSREVLVEKTWYDLEKTKPHEEYEYYASSSGKVKHGYYKRWYDPLDWGGNWLAVEGAYRENRAEGTFTSYHAQDGMKRSNVSLYSDGLKLQEQGYTEQGDLWLEQTNFFSDRVNTGYLRREYVQGALYRTEELHSTDRKWTYPGGTGTYYYDIVTIRRQNGAGVTTSDGDYISYSGYNKTLGWYPVNHHVLYYDDGAKAAEGDYAIGDRIGNWTNWYPSGRISREEGRAATSTQYEWYKDYRDDAGNTLSAYVTYHSNGRIATSTTYDENGVVTSVTRYDEQGNIIP